MGCLSQDPFLALLALEYCAPLPVHAQQNGGNARPATIASAGRAERPEEALQGPTRRPCS